MTVDARRPLRAPARAAPLDAVASWFVVLWGWRRLAAAFVAGGVSVLALPPFDVFPVLFATFPVVVWLLDGTLASGPRARLRAAAAAAGVGWAFGFGYFLAGLYWIGAAFLVDAETFGWMMPFAVAALPAGLALFTAFGFAAARLLWSDGPGRIFAFAAGLALSEFARGHVLTGFPWNLFGYALTGIPALMQTAALVGVYGLTVAAAVVFAGPAALAGGGTRATRWAVPLTGVLLLAGMAGYGLQRLPQTTEPPAEAAALRIVQPSIRQADKWRPENRSRIFADYLELSDRATSPRAMAIGDVDLLVWPESALPFTFDREPNALPAIAALLPEGTTLVTGMQRTEGQASYNSVMVIDAAGTISDVYDKTHLVPFGEYLPMQATLESLGLRQLTGLPGGFEPGPARHVMRAPGAPAFQPLICYEIVFPGAVVDTRQRPEFMLNVTNDGWFGTTAGPWQHLRQARVRAVEEGLPVIRAANTGVSAVIDAYGRTIASLGLGVRGVVDSRLPVAIAPPPYATWGNVWAYLMLVVAVAIAVLARRR